MYKTGKIKIFIYFQRSQSSSRENRGSSLAPQLTGGSSRDSSRSSKERPISGLPSTLAKQLAGSSSMPPGLYFTVKNVENIHLLNTLEKIYYFDIFIVQNISFLNYTYLMNMIES